MTINDLLRVAEAAGRWDRTDWWYPPSSLPDADAAYIAALSPAVAIALLRVAQALPDLIYEHGDLLGSDGSDVLAGTPLALALAALADLDRALEEPR